MSRVGWRRAAALVFATAMAGVALTAPTPATAAPGNWSASDLGTASGGAGVQALPVIHWVMCDSGGRQITCTASVSNWTRIEWLANGSLRLVDQTSFAPRTCTPGQLWTIRASNASGTVNAAGGTCRSGDWP